MKKLPKKLCEYCGKEYQPRMRCQRFCCKHCSNLFRYAGKPKPKDRWQMDWEELVREARQIIKNHGL